MSNHFINNSIYGIDAIFQKYGLEETIGVNGYPLLAVVFNLALLAVPYFIFVFLKKYKNKTGLKSMKNKIWALALGFLWLIFMPNVVYIISDVRHLNGFCPNRLDEYRICVETAWMIPFFFIYALIGAVAFVYFLNQMKGLVAELFNAPPKPHPNPLLTKERGPKEGTFNPPTPLSKGGATPQPPLSGGRCGNIFIISVIPFVSLGFLLGLFNRWNSWEIFVDPLGILKTVFLYFTDLTYFLNWLAFTAFLYALYCGGSWLSHKIKNQT